MTPTQTGRPTTLSTTSSPLGLCQLSTLQTQLEVPKCQATRPIPHRHQAASQTTPRPGRSTTRRRVRLSKCLICNFPCQHIYILVLNQLVKRLSELGLAPPRRSGSLTEHITYYIIYQKGIDSLYGYSSEAQYFCAILMFFPLSWGFLAS